MNETPSRTLPAFPDLQAGMACLARLPLANPAAAEEALGQFLDSLLAAPPDPQDLFALLEQARAPMSFVEEEMARRFLSKPLVLGDVEEAAFQRVVAGWRRMARAYARCAQLGGAEAPGPAQAARVALILHRCIHYTGQVIFEHFRARRELPPGLWLELHGYYETAEEWGVALQPVEDVLERDNPSTHCAAAYINLLLLDLASPYSLSVRNLHLVRRWAGMWSPLVSLAKLDPALPQPPYAVELMQDAGLHPTATALGGDARRFDTARLAIQLNQVMGQLRQRIPPSQLGLGEETSAHVIRLLEQVGRHWTQGVARKFRRFPTTGSARVAAGFEAIHFFVSGEEFVQPDVAETYSRAQFDALFTFRQMVEPTNQSAMRPVPDFPSDEWAVTNHSANGFRLARSEAGQKLGHGQLLAVRPHDGDRYLLAEVAWLMQEQGGGLVAGLAVLPGMPEAVAVRLAEAPQGKSEPFVRAFLLPKLPAIDAVDSLVLPSGTYQASRSLDVRTKDGRMEVRMKNMLQRGVDFDRISFERIG